MKNNFYKIVKLNQSATRVVNKRRLQSGVKEVRKAPVTVGFR